MLMRSPLARDKRRPPGFIRPAQPVLATKVPTGDGWIHELKHDGFRIVALKYGDEVRLWSRNGRNWSGDFLAITAAVMALPATRIVLDGEAVAHCPQAGLQRAPAPLWVRYGVPLRLRPNPSRRRGPARARARRAPGAAPGASQARRAGAALQRSPGRRRRRGHVPPRLRHGPRRHRLEARHEPLQVRPVRGVGEGEEPGL
jgi:hypothetical protein